MHREYFLEKPLFYTTFRRQCDLKNRSRCLFSHNFENWFKLFLLYCLRLHQNWIILIQASPSQENFFLKVHIHKKLRFLARLARAQLSRFNIATKVNLLFLFLELNHIKKNLRRKQLKQHKNTVNKNRERARAEQEHRHVCVVYFYFKLLL